MQSFVCRPSLDRTLPESVISQENNSPYIEFQTVKFSWISIVQLIKFNHKCMHNHLSSNIPKYKSGGKIHFHEKKNVYSSIRHLYCCDITEISTVPPERPAYKKLFQTLKKS